MSTTLLYRLSLSLFAAAAAASLAGVLTVAGLSLPPGPLWLAGAGVGLLGVLAGSAYAFFSARPDRWWVPLGVGLALLVASVVATPFASAASSASYVWAHRAEADRIADVVLSHEWASNLCRSDDAQCTRIPPEVFGNTFRAAWGGTRHGASVHLVVRGDWAARYAPEGVDSGPWTIPLGDGWKLVPR